MKFQDLELAEPILRAVEAKGYTTPSPIQEQSIPHVMAGRDVLGCAQTGTGKTASFALPMLHRLMQASLAAAKANGTHSASGEATAVVDAPQPPTVPVAPKTPSFGGPRTNTRGMRDGRGNRQSQPRPRADRVIRALILAPTRELAVQIDESFRVYGRHTGLRTMTIYGGVSQSRQTQALQIGVDIVVATPGRLLDLMNQGYVDLSHVEMFVLDEADRMFDMGFINDIRKVIAKLPKQRQTLLFSATMPKEIRQLADAVLRNPARVQVAAESAAADTVGQSLYYVSKQNKPALLAHLLETGAMTRTLVFTRTKHGADKVVRQLHKSGIRAEAVHGDKSQAAREKALARFKAGQVSVLIATDIAARGIDVAGISHVFNFDVPYVAETYVHRIGRTGRAGATGEAIVFCDHDERQYVRDIERLLRTSIPVMKDQPAYTVAGPSAGDSDSSERSSSQGQGNRGGGQNGGQRSGGQRSGQSRSGGQARSGGQRSGGARSGGGSTGRPAGGKRFGSARRAGSTGGSTGSSSAGRSSGGTYSRTDAPAGGNAATGAGSAGAGDSAPQGYMSGGGPKKRASGRYRSAL